jgi:hypothetical protein
MSDAQKFARFAHSATRNCTLFVVLFWIFFRFLSLVYFVINVVVVINIVVVVVS